MSAKQDRAAPRTVADIERKYNFGKSFAEIIGLIDDTREEVDSAYSSLKSDIAEQTTELWRSTSEIVAKATETAERIEKNVNESLDDVNESVDGLTSIVRSVEAKVTAENLSITVQQEIAKGVDKVEIKGKDYVFDSEGLKINETGSGMSNLLDNTGMFVKRDGVDILTANSEGVSAKDLHAKTFLKIGSGDGRCRFEDYGTTRIGCFWTGG
jgi:methyl-accepting chemotaxis protein